MMVRVHQTAIPIGDSEFDRSKVHVIVIILCDCVNIPFFLSVYFVFVYIKFIFECRYRILLVCKRSG